MTKALHITEIRGLKDGEIIMEDIFTYDIDKIDSEGRVIGKWVASGITPLFLLKFKKLGVTLSEDIFRKG